MRVTKNVFLDSSAIIGQNLDFSSPSLARLTGLALAREVSVFTTSIVIAEVEAKLRERIREAQQEFVKLTAKHPVLKIVPDELIQALLTPIDSEKAEREFVDRYRRFRNDTGTTVIPLELASTSDVFDSYFSKKAPFGIGKKKSEFPDAFNISALERWCRDRREKMYVVSGDSDLIEHCKSSEFLVGLSKPSEYIDEYSREDETLRRVEQSVLEHQDQLQEAISVAFEECGFFLEDQEGKVNGVEADDVDIDDLSLLQLDGTTAVFEVSGGVAFTATISYLDPDTGFWDNEDGVTIGMETTTYKVKRRVEFTLTANVGVSNDGHYERVQTVQFPRGDFAVSTVEDVWR
jgi:hypothetical protein